MDKLNPENCDFSNTFLSGKFDIRGGQQIKADISVEGSLINIVTVGEWSRVYSISQNISAL